MPAALTVLVVNDCGLPLNLAPIDSSSGIYSGTWTPLGVSAQVTATAKVTAAGFISATTRVTGEVTGNATPVLTQNGILNAFSPVIGNPVAPGAILQIYGSDLAAQHVAASTLPLSALFGQTSVLIGGIAAPLFFVSPGRINAQAPFELAPGRQYQVVVKTNGALTAPAKIAVASAVPALAAYPGGVVIAQHLDASLVSETAPAKAGEYIVLYLTGMGAVDGKVADVAMSPSDPAVQVLSRPTLTLNGAGIAIQFAGLTPGAVGLYQINLLIPVDTPDGDMQVVVAQSGNLSNSGILPVRQ